MNVTAYSIGERFVGVKELPGEDHDPFIMAMLTLDNTWPEADEVPWCSAFVNWVAWVLRLPRSKSLRARSWLRVGTPIDLRDARQGFDVCILSRSPQGVKPPGPDVIEAPGHVGFYSARVDNVIHMLGGNQSNGVNVSGYRIERLLGVRRLYADPESVNND